MTDTPEAVRLPDPFGYLCDWGNDAYGLPRQIVYYGEPGSATEGDWNESPNVHRNTPIYTAEQVAALLRRIPELEAEVKKLEMLNGMASTCIQMVGVERDKLLSSERCLSASYVRIREAIGAMRPPSLEAEALWSYVEQTARDLVAERDQLRAELEKVRVPEGWKLVPEQMTDAMRDAGNEWICNRYLLQRAWHSAVSASPTPPHADQKGQ